MEYKINNITIQADPDRDILTVYRGGSFRTAKIKDNSEYVFKLNKRYIQARGGAPGLFEYIKKCYNDNFCTCYADKIINFIYPIDL